MEQHGRQWSRSYGVADMNEQSVRRALRILCISPRFPPAASAEAFVSAKLVLALLDAGVEVRVLTASPTVEFGPGSYREDHSLIWDRLGPSVHMVGGDGQGRFGGLRKVHSALKYGALFTHPILVDMFCAAARDLMAEQEFDAVYTRSHPLAAHLVGLHLKRRFGSPWIANFNDCAYGGLLPEPFRQAGPLLPTLSHVWALRRVLANADAVTFCCERLAEAHLRGGDRRKNGLVRIIPHIGQAVGHKDCRDSFVVLHAGNLSDFGRGGSCFLGGFQRFLQGHPEAKSTAMLKMVGAGGGEVASWAAEHGISHNVVATPRVPYEESLREIAGCSVAVLIEAPVKEGIFFPSKLADYLCAEKPVLAISPAAGTVSDMFSRGGGGIRVDYDDTEGAARALGRFYEAWRENRLSHWASTHHEVLAPSRVAQRFVDVIRQCVKS